MSFIATGAILYTGYQSKKAAKEAGQMQVDASREAQAYQQQATEQMRRDLSPYQSFGGAGLDPLSELLGYGGYQEDPTLRGSEAYQAAEQATATDERNRIIDYYRTEWGIQNPTEQQIRDATTQAGAADQIKHGKKPFEVYAAENPLSDRFVYGGSELAALEHDARMKTQADQRQQIVDYYRTEWGIQNPTEQQIFDATTDRGRADQQKHGKTLYSDYAEANPLPDRYAEIQAPEILPPDQRPGAQPFQPSYETNPLYQQGLAERAAYDPMNQPLLARAQQDRMNFDPMANPLMVSATEKQMAFDPMANMGPDILQNPLLRAMQEDVTRRLMANQAARGKLGSGGTAESLQNALVPQAINFGLQLNELQRQDIADRSRLGASQVAMEQQAMAGREGLGYGLDELGRAGTTGRLQAGLTQEDLEQRRISNLMGAAQMGQNSAAQVGSYGLNSATQMGNLSLAAGQAGAAGLLGATQAQNQMIGGLAGAAAYGLGSYKPTATLGTSGMNTTNTNGFMNPSDAQWGALGLNQTITPRYQ